MPVSKYSPAPPNSPNSPNLSSAPVTTVAARYFFDPTQAVETFSVAVEAAVQRKKLPPHKNPEIANEMPPLDLKIAEDLPPLNLNDEMPEFPRNSNEFWTLNNRPRLGQWLFLDHKDYVTLVEEEKTASPTPR